MSEKDLKQWSNLMFEELKELEKKKHRILKRCCRAVLNGAVEITTCEDPLLMNVYTPKLNFCPERGEPIEPDM